MSLNELINPAGDPVSIVVNELTANNIVASTFLDQTTVLGLTDVNNPFNASAPSIFNSSFIWSGTAGNLNFNLPFGVDVQSFLASEGVVIPATSGLSFEFAIANASGSPVTVRINAAADSQIFPASPTVIPQNKTAFVKYVVFAPSSSPTKANIFCVVSA